MYRNVSIMNETEAGAIDGYVSDQISEQLAKRCERWGIDVSLVKNKGIKKFAILDSLYVNENKRNLGIGTALLERFITDCQNEGVDVILLEADTEEDNAFDLVEWYKKFGFCDLVPEKHILCMDFNEGEEKKFIVLTTISGITSEKEMEAESLETLLDKISRTQRASMEYQIHSARPFSFDTLLYSHHKNEN